MYEAWTARQCVYISVHLQQAVSSPSFYATWYKLRWVLLENEELYADDMAFAIRVCHKSNLEVFDLLPLSPQRLLYTVMPVDTQPLVLFNSGERDDFLGTAACGTLSLTSAIQHTSIYSIRLTGITHVMQTGSMWHWQVRLMLRGISITVALQWGVRITHQRTDTWLMTMTARFPNRETFGMWDIHRLSRVTNIIICWLLLRDMVRDSRRHLDSRHRHRHRLLVIDCHWCVCSTGEQVACKITVWWVQKYASNYRVIPHCDCCTMCWCSLSMVTADRMAMPVALLP